MRRSGTRADGGGEKGISRVKAIYVIHDHSGTACRLDSLHLLRQIRQIAGIRTLQKTGVKIDRKTARPGASCYEKKPMSAV